MCVFFVLNIFMYFFVNDGWAAEWAEALWFVDGKSTGSSFQPAAYSEVPNPTKSEYGVSWEKKEGNKRIISNS
jgi:hypothetical protein